jgi:hypothetical protein
VGVLMDLVAGDYREILLAIATDDWAGLRDPARFTAWISLGGGMDQTWLDLFSQAARETGGGDSPSPFSESVYSIDGRPVRLADRTLERVDADWIDAVAMLPEDGLDRLAARWIDLIDREERSVDPDDKPMLRQLAGELVDFCRLAERAEDVLFAWSL